MQAAALTVVPLIDRRTDRPRSEVRLLLLPPLRSTSIGRHNSVTKRSHNNSRRKEGQQKWLGRTNERTTAAAAD